MDAGLGCCDFRITIRSVYLMRSEVSEGMADVVRNIRL